MSDKQQGKNKNDKQVEKKLENFIPDITDDIKTKLQKIAIKSHGNNLSPKIITLEEIKRAFQEWKLENQIHNPDITLSQCKELSLSFQKILQISNLESLVSLEKLKLDNNMIMKIENLEKLVNLNWLDLSFNSITKIEGLNTLTNLLDLSLYCNKIVEVEGLDNCRKLHVFSIGMNHIRNCKEMVFYLKKFTNLRALNVADNPFAKDDTNIQMTYEQKMQQKIYYPSSYDPILANLSTLKYLDWKPIDEEKRKIAEDNNQSNNQKDKLDLQANDEIVQKLNRDEEEFLRKAKMESIHNFFDGIVKKIQEDLKANNYEENWHIFKKMQGFNDAMENLSKHIENQIKPYREDILKTLEEREGIIRIKITEIEEGHKMFVKESKDLVSRLKREFKAKTVGRSVNANEVEEIQNKIKKLSDDLMEIYIHEKKQIEERIGLFRQIYSSKKDKMIDRTGDLKTNLENFKTELKESLAQIKAEYDKKLEVDENEEAKTDRKDNEEDKLLEQIAEHDTLTEIEKINDIYEEKINLLVYF